MFHICTKFRENISKGFRVIEGDTVSPLKFSKGHNSIKNEDRITVLRLIMLYICTKFHENILKAFRVIKWTQCPYIFKGA